jgi:hypothetical protein
MAIRSGHDRRPSTQPASFAHDASAASRQEGTLMTAKSHRTPAAKAHDRIVIESERVGQPPRTGEILGVTQSPFGPSYDVRWDDGHESSFRPAAGSARIIPHAAR